MEKCKIQECIRDSYCKGYCKAHYDQIRKAKRITRRILPPPRKCKANNCNRDAVSAGYCKRHYEQFKRNGKVFAISVHDQNEIVIKSNYAEVVLYNIKCEEIARTKIDLDDIEKIKGHRCGITYGYAYIYLEHHHRVRLNRYILNAPSGKLVDHINHDKLDNRKQNLRLCNDRENARNKRPSGKSGVCGVYWDKSRNKWQSHIKINNRSIFLGRFEKKQDAIEARKKSELKYFGEFSYLNGVDIQSNIQK